MAYPQILRRKTFTTPNRRESNHYSRPPLPTQSIYSYYVNAEMFSEANAEEIFEEGIVPEKVCYTPIDYF